MPFRIKTDEDLPKSLSERLATAGYDVHTVHDEGMVGAKDPRLWREVQSEGRFLVTADKGFGDIRFYPPGTHQGVLVLRPDQDGTAALLTLIHQVLKATSLDRLSGCVAVANPRGLRIRRPPATR